MVRGRERDTLTNQSRFAARTKISTPFYILLYR